MSAPQVRERVAELMEQLHDDTTAFVTRLDGGGDSDLTMGLLSKLGIGIGAGTTRNVTRPTSGSQAGGRVTPSNGTTVAASNMEVEHGGGGRIGADRQMETVLAFLRDRKANDLLIGGALGGTPAI